MDGSYGNVFGGTPPMSPDTPTSNSNQYKVNVSRQKTRKWAEFKPANYDGDDWGGDDDGTDDDPPPPPPQKHPMGPRQPSAPLPSARQFTPSTSPPSLQLQTQRLAPAGTPASAGGAFGRTGVDNLVSPQSAVPQSAAATVSSIHSNPQPASAEALPTRTRSPAAPMGGGRFPPRKSSMGAQDGQSPTQLAGSTPHSRSSSRPGSSHNKPWTEGRPASPARSPLASPPKPLPFVRPADIYRRMEEEKEKERERRSMESGGRPSFDGVGSSSHTAERAEPAPAPQVQPKQTEQKQADEPQEAHAGRNLRPSLATVAERKSEYGLEGLIDSYGSDDMVADLEPVASPTSVSKKPPPSELEPAQGLRRYSTSPKLPELGRMSMFGDDFFSTASKLSSQPPPMPNTSHLAAAATQPPALDKSAAGMQGSIDVVQADNAAAQSAEATTQAPIVSPPKEEPKPSPLHQGPAAAAPPDIEPPQPQVPAAEAARHPASSPEDKQPVRPPLPGGWVTETVETPGDFQAPPEGDAPQTASRKALESGKMTPPAKPEDTAGWSTEGEDGRPRATPSAADDSAGVPAATSVQLAAPKVPHFSLPPLSTGTPPLNASLQAAPSPTAPQTNSDAAQPEPQPTDIATPGSELASPVPTPGSANDPQITPTAPLNPSRSAQNVSLRDQFVPPPSFETSSTLDTTSSSPVKESDMLREEIIKSLSPLGPSGDYLEVTGDSTNAYHAAAANPVRESSYLGDVYGDYWASTEDKPVSTQPEVQPESQKAAHIPPPTTEPPVPLSPPGPKKSDDIPPLSAKAEGKSSVDLRRRFSWEAESKASNSVSPPGTTGEQHIGAGDATQVSIAEPVLASPTASPSPPIPRLETTGLSTETSGGISHQVSGASTLPARSTNEPIEPPSPISVRSERNDKSDDNKFSSLDEDKVLLQPSNLPLNLSLPSEVTAEPAESYRPPSEAAPSQAGPVSPTTNTLLSIMTFRQIMELETSAEKVKSFTETRLQFASIDTGLNDWISTLSSQHPEHTNVSSSFRDGLVGPGGMDSQLVGQAPSQVNVQSSFFHQHNASTAGFGQGGIRTANMPIAPTLSHASPMGHPSAQVAQVGAKSKKLLMAAGKAGKGLLNKGKNKLSGGDKVFFNS
ncbi:hypothetical protein QBC34DRAFT_15718 [Podospora aff. communis PSN243]|uniref:Uncharacterized protein n=1 Tax=Podospora aff. communis PSN243 TaxID=3040156 RepID=A0AAV9GZZ4_9PEZI|nr:hypothetical protein QBC34DRAFT_15718 [Podospora aff. communis PSN243]